MSIKAGQNVTYFPDLGDANARAGRHVSIGSTLYLDAKPSPAVITDVQNALTFFLAASSPAADAGVVREAGSGYVLETGAKGNLKVDYASVEDLKRAFLAAQLDRFEFGDAPRLTDHETSALDLGGESRTVKYNPTYHDPTGEVNPDFTLNKTQIVKNGLAQGVKNVGEAAGSIAAGLGGGVKGVLGGVFSGLGVGWTIALVLVLLLAAAVVAYLWIGRLA